MKRHCNRIHPPWRKTLGLAVTAGSLLAGLPAPAGDKAERAEKPGAERTDANSDAARQRKIREWIESIRKSKTWRGYRIGGRVIDQYGNPVPDAEVEVHSTTGRTVFQLLNQPYVAEYHLKTDADGRFRVKVRGIQPIVADIEKFGYVWLRSRDNYPSTVVLPDRTLWVNPHLAAGDAVFHMWKKGPRSILLRCGLYLGFHEEDRTHDFVKPVRLLPFFDWRQKRGKDFEDFRQKVRKRLEAADPFASAEDRDLLMSLGFDMAVRVHPDPKAEKWRVTLWMFRPDDGMLFTTDRRLAVAPETGYKRQLDFSVPFKYRDENGHLLPERLIRGRIFFRFFKPVLYSTCLFSIESGAELTVGAGNYVVNPYGGRNLEPDWGIPDKIIDALEDELKAAILAADAGKPVTLPDEAKYKKMLEDLLAKDKEARKIYIRANTDTTYQTW